jgi:hypothetical protein
MARPFALLAPTLLVPALLALLVIACVGDVTSAPPVETPFTDRAEPLAGVPDRGADPSVLALDRGGDPCAGVLLAPNLILTAGRCAPSAPETVRVLVGEEVATAIERARGLEVLRPDPGSPDVAVLVLDESIDDVAALPARTTGPPRGGHVRTVGFAAGGRVVRDHVPQLETDDRAFDVAEAACEVAPGGAALDEASAAIVGILTGSGPGCVRDSGRETYARIDPISPFVTQALALGRLAAGDRAQARRAQKTKKGPVDLGAACAHGGDCAAGVCVTYAAAQYCSRICGPHDPCPAHFACMATQSGPMACVEH